MTKNSLKVIAVQAIVSLGGVGYIRPASATWGSLVAGICLFFWFPQMSGYGKIVVIFITFIIGVILSEYVTKIKQLHDPHFIVIDELVGMMIVVFFLSAIWWQYLLAFILFRVFDIAKLWPASYFDKQLGGFSVMFDDVLMAIFALAALHLILYFV